MKSDRKPHPRLLMFQAALIEHNRVTDLLLRDIHQHLEDCEGEDYDPTDGIRDLDDRLDEWDRTLEAVADARNAWAAEAELEQQDLRLCWDDNERTN